MTILLQKFDSNRISALSRLFSDDIDLDPWVMFHGTSGYNAVSIEQAGFTFRPDFISRDQIQHVVKIYETMRWSGESGGGYPVLKAFSLDYDLRAGERGPVFFSETSLRALLYATHDFSGGEKLRALRMAFRDLESYLIQADIRQRHQERMYKNFRHLSSLNANSSMIDSARPVGVDLGWLRNEMASLKDIRHRAEYAYQRHDYGVVYALRMAPNELEGLHWYSSMGIESTTSIPASKVVAKIVVPPEYEENLLFDTGEEYMRRMSLGLIPAIGAMVR